VTTERLLVTRCPWLKGTGYPHVRVLVPTSAIRPHKEIDDR
jgi:hypothetical protein